MNHTTTSPGTTTFNPVETHQTPLSRSLCFLILGTILTLLAACGGSGGGADGGGATAPLSAGIAANTQRNPANVINQATATSVEIEVEFGPEVSLGDSFEVVLSDGTNIVSAFGSAVPNSTVPVGPIDASSLNDGPITLSVTVSSGANSTTTNYGAVLTKDTTAPEPAILVELPAGSNNPVDTANSNNSSSLTMNVGFAATASASDLISLVATDGQTMVTSVAQNIIPGGTNAFAGFDISGLMDGSLTIDAVASDAAGNTSMLPLAVQKDTVVPDVTLARINASAQNPANTINGLTAAGPAIDIIVDATAVLGDMIAVRATDEDGTVLTSLTQQAPVGGGSLTFTALDVTSLSDGNVNIEIMMSDSAGNNLPKSPFAALKDTVVSEIAEAFVADGPQEASNFINQGNASSVVVSLTFRSGKVEANDEQARVIITAGGVSVTSPVKRLQTGATSVEIGPFDASSLSDGTYTLTVEIEDTQGNRVSYNGSPGVVDLGGPQGIVSASIPAGGQNPINTVNSLTAV